MIRVVIVDDDHVAAGGVVLPPVSRPLLDAAGLQLDADDLRRVRRVLSRLRVPFTGQQQG